LDRKHEVLADLKRIASELGKAPTRDEFRSHTKTGEEYRREFGGYIQFLHAAGFKGKELAKEHKSKKFKFAKSQIESFKIHDLDLDEIFERFGNPEVIRMTAQPDTHMKNRDQAAVDAYLEFVEYYKPHIALIGGDLMDAEGVSHWPSQSLEPRRFIPEVIETREFLDALRSKCGDDAEIIYIEGNHESWISQAMAAKMPEFFSGLEELGLMPDLSALLELEKRRIPLIPVNEILKIGKTHFTHGLYTGPGHPKKHLSVIKGNIYYFHVHDFLATHEPTMSGFIEAASMGCLCRLDAPFLKGKPNNWGHGFGVFEFRRDHNYSFYCVKMFDRKFSFNGRLFGYR
jgi:hypothetical protein